MTTLRFLGTGWSHGVPMVDCDCAVCTGRDPRNRRRRPSILVEDGEHAVVVDVGPDFREQALACGLHRLDAVFITHAHADHVMGLDDVRRLTWRREAPLPIRAEPSTRERLATLYPYAARTRTPGKAVPRVRFETWEAPVTVGAMTFTPFAVPHGPLPCRGVRIEGPGGAAAYVPDCSDLPPETRPFVQGLDVMILNALRFAPHPHHLTLERSKELLLEIGAARSYFTHMGCPIDYSAVEPTLPDSLHLAYDGLEVEW